MLALLRHLFCTGCHYYWSSTPILDAVYLLSSATMPTHSNATASASIILPATAANSYPLSLDQQKNTIQSIIDEVLKSTFNEKGRNKAIIQHGTNAKNEQCNNR